VKRRVYDEELHAHFVTFSCFGRRRLLDRDECKDVVLRVMGDQLLKQQARCLGFVIMPDHVHAMVWFPTPAKLSAFMKSWKQRNSFVIRKLLPVVLPHYAETLSLQDPIWQPRYFEFNVYSEKKVLEKLTYMHGNPVKAGLVGSPCEWRFSSARFYERGEDVGVPIFLFGK
jgi:REP-associated tyrosine transposase